MIRELGRNTITDWYEKIQIELNLHDLQLLYDCLGATPIEYIKEKHKYTPFSLMETVYNDISVDLYEGLHTILSEHNGITDDNKMVNTNIELEVIKDE